MKLVYTKTPHVEVKVGDKVRTSARNEVTVIYFAEPHKSSSEGKVTVKHGKTGPTQEFYVSVIGAEWILREDRLQNCGHPESAIVTNGITHHCSICEASAPVVGPKLKDDEWKIVEVEVNQHKITASITLTCGDKCMEIDVRIVSNMKIIFDAENLITGSVVPFGLLDVNEAAIIDLNSPLVNEKVKP